MHVYQMSTEIGVHSFTSEQRARVFQELYREETGVVARIDYVELDGLFGGEDETYGYVDPAELEDPF